MDDLSSVSRSEDLAVLRTQFKEAVIAPLHISDQWGIRLSALLYGADQQGDQEGDKGPGSEVLLEKIFHVIPTWRR